MLTFVIYLLIGVFAGITAGLFGVGGGLVVVPALILCFSLLDISPVVLTQLAIGTSLATIVITSISSTRAHHLHGNVLWPLFWTLSPGIMLGVWLGANATSLMTGKNLQLIFGVFVLIVSLQMGLGLKPKASRQLPSKSVLTVIGGVIGSISAMLGIGGGSLTVPYLTWCNINIRKVVATSAACGLPIAVIGTFSNIVVGWERDQLPEFSTGFIYWPAVICIAITSSIFARFGAQLAQKLPSDRLKRYFAIFLFLVGVQFIVKNI